jgi:hypothetical protein
MRFVPMKRGWFRPVWSLMQGLLEKVWVGGKKEKRVIFKQAVNEGRMKMEDRQGQGNSALKMEAGCFSKKLVFK